MSFPKLNVIPSDTVYLYDGSLAGFFCCVHESIYQKQLPFAITPEYEAQTTFLFKSRIITDMEKAKKVRLSIVQKIAPRALELVENVFLSCLPQKEVALLRFLLVAYKEGAKVLDMLSHPEVAPLLKAEHHLMGERHLLLGFIRFSDDEGKLLATITPKNFVLPFIASHFIERFPRESFMIYDKTHHAALVYQNRKAEIIQLDEMILLNTSQEEEHYRALWKQFYKTIAIPDRYNPKCRMTHMPKRYWENMTEMQDKF